MKVFDAAAARAVDRYVIDEIGLPGVVLMEHAAEAVVDVLMERWPAVHRVAVVCGPGNNGGDGWAVARLLVARRIDCEVVALGGGSGDAAVQARVTKALGVVVHQVGGPTVPEVVERLLADADVVVDALFGVGLDRPLVGLAAELVAAIVASGRPVLSVDLPSGLDAGSSRLPEVAVWADATVTFVAPKIAHAMAPAAEACGEVVVAELGFPASVLERFDTAMSITSPEDFERALPPPARDLHKGQAGRVLVVAGSLGMAGAAVLAGRAALRAGAGLVTLAVPDPIAPVIATASLETMTLALDACSRGRVAASAVAAVLETSRRVDAVALGPGLGGGTLDAELAATLRRMVLGNEAPMVIDADGLNAFEGCIGELADRAAPTVLTPHPGELARLLDATVDEVQSDRLAAVREAAWCARSVVLLKGRQTLVATADGAVAITPTGGPALATAGAGDVLTGVVVALLGAGLGAFEAARIGAYWHGLTGDRVASERGERGVLAGDVVEALPRTRPRQ